MSVNSLLKTVTLVWHFLPRVVIFPSPTHYRVSSVKCLLTSLSVWSRLWFEPRPSGTRVQHANHSATEPPLLWLAVQKLLIYRILAEWHCTVSPRKPCLGHLEGMWMLSAKFGQCSVAVYKEQRNKPTDCFYIFTVSRKKMILLWLLLLAGLFANLSQKPKFLLHVAGHCGSVLLLWQYNTDFVTIELIYPLWTQTWSAAWHSG